MNTVKIICAADGTPTPHNERYVVAWNPHTKAGTLELTSTADRDLARRFEGIDAFTEWKTVSRIQPKRPWDLKPNRPLCALTILTEQVDE